jgi:hypothetical protein
VSRLELACCGVGWDDALMAMRPNRAALRLPSEPAARTCRQLVCLHGMENWRPTRRSGGVHAPGWRHVACTVSWSETETTRVNEQVVGAGTCCARWRLAREASPRQKTCRGNSQLVGSMTSCQRGSLTVILSRPCAESWPYVVDGVIRLRPKSDCLVIKGCLIWTITHTHTHRVILKCTQVHSV